MLYDAPRRLSLLAEILHFPASLGLHGVDYSCKSEPEHDKVVQRKQEYKIPFSHVISSELFKRTQEKTYTIYSSVVVNTYKKYMIMTESMMSVNG